MIALVLNASVCKIRDGLAQAFSQRNRRLPAKQSLGSVDIRLALFGVVLRQRHIFDR